MDRDYLKAYLLALANEDEEAMRSLDIPPSDVYYVREAILLKTGKKYSLEHVMWAMRAEGMIK